MTAEPEPTPEVTPEPTPTPHVHNYELESVTQPTCVEAGVRESVCTVCSAKTSKELDIAPHSWDFTMIQQAPTCCVEDSGINICTFCGINGESYMIPVDTSVPVDTATRVVKEGDCTTVGIKEVYCTGCSAVTETIEDEFHNNVLVSEYSGGEWAEYQCTKCEKFTYQFKYSQAEAIDIMLAKVNALRASVGVDPLVLNGNMISLAKIRAQAITIDFSHNGATSGENIVKGCINLDEQFNAWLNSPGHYANMINPNYKTFGYAYAFDSDSTYMYGVQTFNYF